MDVFYFVTNSVGDLIFYSGDSHQIIEGISGKYGYKDKNAIFCILALLDPIKTGSHNYECGWIYQYLFVETKCYEDKTCLRIEAAMD